MDIEDLVKSYRQYVQARIQAQEIGSFGGGLLGMFENDIARHQRMESEFIQAEVYRRAAEVEGLRVISKR